MKAYIVTVRPGSSDRYTDSIWLSPAHANERAEDIVQEFGRRGKPAKSASTNEGWAAWVSTITIQDGFIPVGKDKAAPKVGGK